MNALPRRLCPSCGHIKDHVTYDLRAHDFRCPDCREPKTDRWTTWEDLDAAEVTA